MVTLRYVRPKLESRDQEIGVTKDEKENRGIVTERYHIDSNWEKRNRITKTSLERQKILKLLRNLLLLRV